MGLVGRGGILRGGGGSARGASRTRSIRDSTGRTLGFKCNIDIELLLRLGLDSFFVGLDSLALNFTWHFCYILINTLFKNTFETIHPNKILNMEKQLPFYRHQ